MSETACCAHLRVRYQTEELPNFGTHGWWACDTCPKRFAPISNTLSDGETARPIQGEAGVNRWADLQAQAKAAQQARCPECQVPLDAATPHVSGCAWQAEQAQLARNSNHTYGNELTNAYRPTQPMTYRCPVCGFRMDDPATDYSICPCCGTEFGYDDFNASHAELRAAWISGGSKWWSRHRVPPANWDPQLQVAELLQVADLVEKAEPQPEEPAPASWWARIARWFHA